ncbi:MAG TPA: glutaredoxin family protein [Actinotalea sp.]|jgi:glutaredoxin
MSGQGVAGERVVLFVRAGCHLCTEARAVVEAVCTQAGAAWTEVDIDEDRRPGGLQERYGELVPVVVVDGIQQGYWRLDADRLRRSLGPRQA